VQPEEGRDDLGHQAPLKSRRVDDRRRTAWITTTSPAAASKRRDVLVYVALFLLVGVAMVVALWYFQHNTLRANFGPDPNAVVFLVPEGSLSQQRKQAADFCGNVGVQRIADALNVDATPLAVSSAYADSVEPSGSLQNRAIRAGCFAGLTR
jgi:hypothetical protein